MAAKVSIVVTGMGAVTPYGVGVPRFWQGLMAGESAVRSTEGELDRWAPVLATVPDFSATDFLARKTVHDTSRFTQFALVAAMEAMRGARLSDDGQRFEPPVARERIGIFLGNSFGDIATMDHAAGVLARDPGSRVGPRIVSKSLPNAAAGQLAIAYGVRGPVFTYTTACASSANAIGEARDWLAAGRIDLAIVGGAESLLAPSLLASLHEAGAIALKGRGDPSTWSRPFDRNRDGMVAGEGAGIMVLERRESAERRGAPVQAELIGYGTSSDAYHQIAPEPSGQGAAITMRMALRDAGLQPDEVGYLNAHATATRAGDVAEARAFRDVFGSSLANIPVSSIKGHIGHVMGAAGTVESIACILAMHTGRLPQNLHCEEPDDGMPPWLVRGEPLAHPVQTALCTSFGFGGQNGAVLWRGVTTA